MIFREDYYKEHPKTAANSDNLLAEPTTTFPDDGFLLGDLVSSSGNIAPALIPLDKTNGICFLSTADNEKDIKKTMQLYALRVVCSLPIGMCRLILFGGKDIVDLIQLRGLDGSINGGNVIGDLKEFKDKLNEVYKDIDHTTQVVLQETLESNPLSTLADYNSTATIPHPYTLILITDFPNSLDEEASLKLKKIVNEGRRAGVYVMMNIDTGTGDLIFSNDHTSYEKCSEPFWAEKMTVIYPVEPNRYCIHNLFDQKANHLINSFKLHLDTKFPEPQDFRIIKEKLCERIQQSKNISINLDAILTNENIWKKISNSGITSPIGITEEGGIQNIEITDQSAHCIIAGDSGMGKSVLLHNIICNTAWMYSPEEVQFVLLDLKQGVGFNSYKHLPHVKVLALNKDIEFAINTASFLIQEMNDRAELFKKEGVSEFLGYRQKGHKLARYLVIIDEFQNLFNDEFIAVDKIKDLIIRLSKEGRSYGIHLIFATQQIDSNYKALISQCKIKIALPLNDTAKCLALFCNYENDLPYHLSKPGQSIYSIDGKLGNSTKYQVALFDQQKIDNTVNALKLEFGKRGLERFYKFIFNQEEPSDHQENEKYGKEINAVSSKKIYIGAPYTLKQSHVYYCLGNGTADNVMILGIHPNAALSIAYHSAKQLLMAEAHRVIICIKSNSNTDTILKQLAEEHNNVSLVDSDELLLKNISEIKKILDERKKGNSTGDEITLILLCAFEFESLRLRGYNLSECSNILFEVMTDGPCYGIHVIIQADEEEQLQGRIFEPQNQCPAKTQILLNSDFAASLKTTQDNYIKKVKLYKI